jgi:hypothetical protein
MLPQRAAPFSVFQIVISQLPCISSALVGKVVMIFMFTALKMETEHQLLVLLESESSPPEMKQKILATPDKETEPVSKDAI